VKQIRADLEAGRAMQAGRLPFRAVEAGGVPQGHTEALGHAAAFEDQNLRRIACQLVERCAHTLLPRVKGEGKGGFRLLPGGELFFCRCAGGFCGHCASFGQKEKSRETDADGRRPSPLPRTKRRVPMRRKAACPV